jgi:hypothetical protein
MSDLERLEKWHASECNELVTACNADALYRFFLGPMNDRRIVHMKIKGERSGQKNVLEASKHVTLVPYEMQKSPSAGTDDSMTAFVTF